MCRLFADVQGISIHSTTRVETGGNIRRKEGPGNFNPLHHEGGDMNIPPTAINKKTISIHSTTRVETCSYLFSVAGAMISIHSTTRVETIHTPLKC